MEGNTGDISAGKIGSYSFAIPLHIRFVLNNLSLEMPVDVDILKLSTFPSKGSKTTTKITVSFTKGAGARIKSAKFPKYKFERFHAPKNKRTIAVVADKERGRVV